MSKKKEKKKKKLKIFRLIGLILLGLVILAGLAFGGYYLFNYISTSRGQTQILENYNNSNTYNRARIELIEEGTAEDSANITEDLQEIISEDEGYSELYLLDMLTSADYEYAYEESLKAVQDLELSYLDEGLKYLDYCEENGIKLSTNGEKTGYLTLLVARGFSMDEAKEIYSEYLNNSKAS